MEPCVGLMDRVLTGCFRQTTHEEVKCPQKFVEIFQFLIELEAQLCCVLGLEVWFVSVKLSRKIIQVS